ncbi:MAG: hypothetical protein KBA81_03880 [Rhabdochlamydiaceae bacterium]|nr:hypothetical protein [Rhabdochlamydiaceae bacterium]
MKRRPFFLLEVLIAVILVGGFAYLSIYGAFRVIRTQRSHLKKIQETLEFDRRYMNAITENWKDPKNPKDVHGFSVKCEEGQDGKAYLLTLKESEKSYQYLVVKSN